LGAWGCCAPVPARGGATARAVRAGTPTVVWLTMQHACGGGGSASGAEAGGGEWEI